MGRKAPLPQIDRYVFPRGQEADGREREGRKEGRKGRVAQPGWPSERAHMPQRRRRRRGARGLDALLTDRATASGTRVWTDLLLWRTESGGGGVLHGVSWNYGSVAPRHLGRDSLSLSCTVSAGNIR